MSRQWLRENGIDWMHWARLNYYYWIRVVARGWSHNVEWVVEMAMDSILWKMLSCWQYVWRVEMFAVIFNRLFCSVLGNNTAEELSFSRAALSGHWGTLSGWLVVFVSHPMDIDQSTAVSDVSIKWAVVCVPIENLCNKLSELRGLSA